MIRLKRSRYSKNCGSLIENESLIWLKLDAAEVNRHLEAGSAKESLPISNFLCSSLAYGLRTLSENYSDDSNHIVVVIECQKLTLKIVKVVLRACQNALAFKIKHAIVLESEYFLEQQKISLDMALETYDFKTTICSRTKLWKHVKRAYLFENNASLQTWTDIKQEFEQHFFSNPVYFGRDGLQYGKCLNRFLKQGSAILIEIGGKLKYRPPPLIPAKKMEVKVVEDEVKEPKDPQVFSSESTDHEVSNILEPQIEQKPEFSSQEDQMTSESNIIISDGEVQEVKVWLNESVMEFVDSLTEMLPKSFEESANLLKKSTDIHGRLTEVRLEIFKSKHPALKAFQEELDRVDMRVRRAMGRLRVCVQVQDLFIKFDREAENLLKLLCTDQISTSVETLKKSVSELDELVGLLECRFREAKELCDELIEDTGTSLGTLLNQNLQSMSERRQRCISLSELRKLKLHQMIQLATCENDCRIVASWLNELASNLTPQDPCTKTNKFEDVARKMGDYGNQLCEVSLLLRRSLRLEISAQTKLQMELLEAFEAFDKSVRAAKKLN
ncbi:unnamed protein product [Bursaphelenchus xylophilus]|uniref:(pine wood nematode) hypothetical protein n=1 Tax=Bursaphelenchus xylophilus TaxID=6326 RepID=A0A7I8XL23_BURXY|nr:unnamed protein product [Bursaphelenchus xylophilus]CAG9086073.1 unnamed protein product [Bursaphelenchus xylophilus]